MSGPVPIEVQKQVDADVVHWTAITSAALRRCWKSVSMYGPPRNTRSWMASAASSQARTPRKASFGISGVTGRNDTTALPSCRAALVGTRGG